MTVLSPSNAPHLYLGVSSQAPQASVTAAFAMATRRLKTASTTTITVQDLTSALSAAERRVDSQLVLQYQAPANVGVIPDATTYMIGDQEVTAGITPEAFPLDKVPKVENENVAGFLLTATLQALHQWRWIDAVGLGQLCLRLSQSEDTRDEALNLMAAAFAMQHEPQKALDALKTAVAGKWNLSLQANLVLVATSISPQTAVEHLSHLILGAESASQRLGASRMAIELWAQVTKDLGGNDAPPLPRPVIDSIYDLSKQAGLSEEEFFDLGLFLAESDSAEFLRRGVIRESPHRSSASARLIEIAARDFGDYAAALVVAENRGEFVDRPWLQGRLDNLIRQINDLFQDEGTEEKPVSFAFGLVDGGLSCKTLERITLLAFMTGFLENEFTDENDVPKDEFVNWIVDAHNRINVRGEFEDRVPEHVELVKQWVQESMNRIMFLFYRGSWNQGIQIEQSVNGLVQENKKWFPNRAGITQASREVVTWCDSVTRNCGRLRAKCNDSELNRHVDELLGHVSQFHRSVKHFS